MSIVKIFTGVSIDSNLWLVRGRSCILIDTGTGMAENYTNNIWRALDGLRLSAVILTHCHADHIGGLARIQHEFGCPAYIGFGDAEALRTADPVKTASAGLGIPINPCPDALGLKEGDSFDLGDHRLVVIETPGHTEGSICLYDEVTGALFSGDTVFAQGYGRVDLPSGSMSEMRESLARLNNVNIKALYPGHGPSVSDGGRSVKDSMTMVGL
ncbi:Zn-dependent hydrolase, including glyoxylase [Thermoplasmatales archaeon BRNA1]|nr:Zn-dependent hydrolase, including glyoxylase [Thermoplasmatales archaeon BRNA1]